MRRTASQSSARIASITISMVEQLAYVGAYSFYPTRTGASWFVSVKGSGRTVELPGEVTTEAMERELERAVSQESLSVCEVREKRRFLYIPSMESVAGVCQMLSLLAILCPPLAVWVAERSGSRTATNVGLTLLLYFPGLIHALST